MEINITIDTTNWERSSDENWSSPSPNSLKMLKNLNHDYIVSDVSFSNYTLSSKVSITQDDDGIGVVFDYINSKNYKYIMYQGGGLTNGWGGDFGTNSSGRVNAVALFQVENGITKRIKENELVPYWSKNSPFEIKLENVFDDVFFYVNDVEFLRYKKQDSILGKIGFVTFSQIVDFEDITITKSITNRAKAKFVLYAVDDTHINTEISSRVSENNVLNTEINIRAFDYSEKDVYLDVKYRGNSDIYTEIQPIGYNNILTEIEVPPHNRMKIMYEVQQPPIVTNIFNPTQDSFTREQLKYQSINYGSYLTMVVGRSEEEIWRSFVQFDLSSVNPSYVLTESYLRLYYKGAVPDNIKLEILNADERWSEFSITHLNKPNPIKLISNEFTVNTQYGYVEFDVLDIVKDWTALKTENNGFVIRIANETEYGQVTFNTRESIRPPELVLKHFDSRIFSQGRSQQLTEIFAIHRGNSDKLTELEVTSAYDASILDTYLYVHRAEVPIESEHDTEITVNKKHIPVEITSAIPVKHDIVTDLAVRIPDEDRVFAEIFVSRQIVLVEVFSKYASVIEAEIISKAFDTSSVDTCVSVNRPIVFTEISSRVSKDSIIDTSISVTRDYILTEIIIPQYGEKSIFVEIEANDIHSSKILTEILVSKTSVATEVSARVGRLKDLYTTLSVTRPVVDIEVFAKYRSEILIEIEPNIKSDVQTEIIVTKPDIEVSLIVKQYGNNIQDTEIFVSYLSEKDAEIDIKVISQVETVIDIKEISQIPVEVTASRRQVNTQIVIPTWVDYWMPTEIRPRVLMVSNAPTMIIVSGYVGGSYAFII